MPPDKPARIQYVSDLHLERPGVKYEYTIPPAAPNLLLVGDIGRFHDREPFAAFLRQQCDNFEQVLLVPGNHEFYRSPRDEGLATARSFCNDPLMKGRLALLHRKRVDLTDIGVTILGCTLHSRIAPDYTRLTNDFQYIQDWTVKKHNEEHDLDLKWLKQALAEIAEQESERRVVIATHYAPAFEKTCHPKNGRNAISQCFASDLLKDFAEWPGAKRVSHWIFGHTHWNTRFKVGKTIVTSNHGCNDSGDLSWLQRKLLFRPFDPTAALSF